MRHRKHSNSLGLVSSHRRALLANLATALLTHGRIETTHAKAKAVRPYIEKLITLAKNGSLHARRQALSSLRYRPIVDRLFNDVAPSFAGRPGGYTRIIKTGYRAGDASPMALIELVEAGYEAKPAAKKPAAKKAASAKEEKVVEESAAEEPAAEAVEATEETAPEAVEAASAEAEPEADAAEDSTSEETKAEDK